MKARVWQTNMRILLEDSFYYIVEIKRHWWSRWHIIRDFSSDNNMPLLFKTRKAAEDYVKELYKD